MTLLTYYDAVEHLITSSAGGPQDAEQSDIRTAVQRAYSELSTMRDWNYYQAHGRVQFAAHWVGSITYDRNTRIINRETGDAFPANAALCRMRVNSTVIKIASRISDTQLLCDATLSPANDIIYASTASLYQDTFPLPTDFRNADSPIDQFAWTQFTYVTADQAMKLENANDLAGPPHAWGIIKDPRGPGWAIRVIGYPVESANLDFSYRRLPRRMRLSGHEPSARQGTISISGTAVTGTGTAFTAGMVGSVLRVGTASESPGGLESMRPYQDEAVITAVASATACTISTSITASAVLYVVTDIVDMPTGMHNGFLSCATYWLARTRGTKPDNAFAMYQRDLRLSMEADQLTPFVPRQTIVWDTVSWRTPLQADDYDGGAP